MTILSKKDIRKCYMNWITFALSCQNMKRMIAPALVRIFGLASEKLYNSKEEQQKLLDRHTQFFNTGETFGSVIPGVILGMGERRAEGEEIPDELIQGMKTALMGPPAGIGDSLIGGTLRPILCSIAMGLPTSTGSIAGPLFYRVAWFDIIISRTQLLFLRGYKLGINVVDVLLVSGRKNIIIRVVNIVGLIVVSAISAQYVSAVSGWSYRSGDMLFSLQGILDSITSRLLSLGLALLAWILLDKKNMKITTVFIIFILTVTVGGSSELSIVAWVDILQYT